MAVYSYAEKFQDILAQKYETALCSYDLEQSNPQVQFINAQTIKLPRLTVSGYKDHTRGSLGFNTGTLANDWEPKRLSHDRDIEFVVDPMDVDETNLTLSVANITNTFETEHLKSSMDRFIVHTVKSFHHKFFHLKSSMDRFIASTLFIAILVTQFLKSSMDRFIDTHITSLPDNLTVFKIQYG